MTVSISKPAASKATKVSASKEDKTSLPHLYPPEKGPVVDGRHHRSLVTRHKIVDALTALIREGELVPTAEQVAFDELASQGAITPLPFEPGVRLSAARCSAR